VYEPDAVAYHHGSATLGPWSGDMVKWMTRNQILLLAKYYPASLLWRTARAVLAAQALWAAMALGRGRGLSYFRGLGAGIAGIPPARRAGKHWRQSGTRLATILLTSEKELEYFERSTGWDRYWRWYFRLAPLPHWTRP
jgi:GT2 family glycosyltransferase